MRSRRGVQFGSAIIWLFVNDAELTQAAVRKNEDEPMLYCPVCSTRLTERKCKLLCEKCGYYLSCADYY